MSKTLSPTEVKYSSHAEKLGLDDVQEVQCFCHYILLHKTTAISDCNPMKHILTHQVLWGKYSKWIFILQEFDLEFEKSKSKKSLVFAELICDLPSYEAKSFTEETFLDESIFLINSSDSWYGDIIIYLKTQTFWPDFSSTDLRPIWYQAHQYIIIIDTLYCCGVDSIFQRCLTHEEVERALNDCHDRTCGGHMSGYPTAKNILREGYFWPSLFKYCIRVVQNMPAKFIIPNRVHLLLLFTP
jgi:hypothetical protein